MASKWRFKYELPSDGTSATRTDNTTQALLEAQWESAEVTLRRRAPDEWTLLIPRWTSHRVKDFTSGREVRWYLDDVIWQAGFINAASLPGGSRGEYIEVRGWSNAFALMMARNTPFAGATGIVYLNVGTDDVIIAALDNVEHAPTVDWFSSGNRTIGTNTITVNSYNPRGISPLEVILQMADAEGWPVRIGMDSGGNHTINVSATAETDLSASIHLVDGANCTIEDDQADGSQIVTNCLVAARVQPFETTVDGNHGSGVSVFVLNSVAGLEPDDVITFEPDGGNTEVLTIATVTFSTNGITTTGASALTHDDGVTVRLDTGNGEKIRSSQSTNATAAQAYHDRYYVVWNDQLAANADLREALADAVVAAYDHTARTNTVAVTDPAMIAILLGAGVRPGDTVTLSSNDRHMSALFSNTAVQIQEMRLALDPGGCRSITLTVGDPALNDLAVLERAIAGARNGALAGGAEG